MEDKEKQVNKKPSVDYIIAAKRPEDFIHTETLICPLAIIKETGENSRSFKYPAGNTHIRFSPENGEIIDWDIPFSKWD